MLGVGGGIAAYKACELLRRLTESGHEVRVVPTESALRFVGAATFEALSGQPVRTGVFADVPEVPHVRLGQEADLVVVAPATADLVARAAHGLADDLLTNTLLTARCPVLMVPAMHTEMWEHPATQDNVALLRARGVVVAEPTRERVRESLEQLGGALADEAQARMVSAMVPSADGVLETGEDVLQASEELLDDMVDSVPGGSVVGQVIDFALIPGRYGVRVATTVLKGGSSEPE